MRCQLMVVCYVTRVLDHVCLDFLVCVFFFFKQKTAYEMRISDWSSDVCSSDLAAVCARAARACSWSSDETSPACTRKPAISRLSSWIASDRRARSEEHTSELQSLMRISYAVFCLKKQTKFVYKSVLPSVTNLADYIQMIPICTQDNHSQSLIH